MNLTKKANIFLQTLGCCALCLTSAFAAAQIVPYDSELIEERYAADIEANRAIENKRFRNRETTVLSDEYFERFTGLNYFPADIKFRVVGKLTRLSESELTNLGMTNGTPYGFMRFGKVNFYLDGNTTELQVFEFPGDSSAAPAIFVPFRDATSGDESYGGGRFMIINIPRGEQIVVDFNLAINPNCVYDPEYICPIPPLSNIVSSRVTAGARMYFDPNDEFNRGEASLED